MEAWLKDQIDIAIRGLDHAAGMELVANLEMHCRDIWIGMQDDGEGNTSG